MKFALNYGISSPSQYTYDLAICAIFQNEARFMKEWIEFHKLVGVRHFYLYNNFSTDNYLDVLEPYIKRGEVELFDWNEKRERDVIMDCRFQYSAYNDALRRANGLVKWLAVIDLDEFLFPVQVDTLVEFLQDYEEYGGVCAQWVMFGTSNVESIPEKGLLLEYLTMCDPNGDKRVKSIVRPERAEGFYDPHFAKYKPGFFQVNQDKVRFEGPINSDSICIDKVRINHYWSGDMQHLLNNKISKRVFYSAKEHEYAKQILTIERCINESRKFNIVEDRTIQKYLGKLKSIFQSKEP